MHGLAPCRNGPVDATKVLIQSKGSSGRERSFARGDRGADPRPALRTRSRRLGEGRIGRIQFAGSGESPHLSAGAIESAAVFASEWLF
jgi:hypothetical protein